MAKRIDKWEAQHRRNVERYQRLIDDIYKEAVREAASLTPLLGNSSPGKPFSFADHPITRQRLKKLLDGLKNGVETSIVNGVRSEWTLANDKNDELCDRVFGDNADSLTDEQRKRFYSNNDKAREAFIARKTAGLNLSDRVWNYTNQFKEEIEMGLDLGLRDGISADAMSRRLRQYLKYPDKLFRRVRDEHGILHLSKRAKAFHPGQGVYRSSYKNARRLAATETNIAYRTSDYTRWQQLDFVTGIEVHLSGNHPVPDICDDLKGRYPKDFKFTGWHPLCRCYTTSILKTEEEMAEDTRRIMAGEEPLSPEQSRNAVNDVPQEFRRWVKDNGERIARAKSLPYFLRDNGTMKEGKYVLREFGKTATQREVRNPLPEHVRKRREELKVLMRKTETKKYTSALFRQELSLPNKSVREWLNQPHYAFEAKNEALANIQNILDSCKARIEIPVKPQHAQSVSRAYALPFKIENRDSYIIVHEMKWGEVKIYGISDDKKIFDK